MARLSKSDFPPASPDTHVHLEAFGVVLSVALPTVRMPRLVVRSKERHDELVRAL